MLKKLLKICALKNFDKNKFLDLFYKLKNDKNIDFDTKSFNTKLPVLGIRVPILRQISRAMYPNLESVLKFDFWYNCYELLTLKGLLIAQCKDAKKVLFYLSNYVSYIDNWASCDLTAGDLKIIGKNQEFFIDFIEKSINDNREFVCRFGVVILMKYYLTDNFFDYTLQKIGSIKSDFYYVNMAIGWAICESFLKNKTKTLEFLKSTKLNDFAVNKGISKICDSFRISQQDKKKVILLKR